MKTLILYLAFGCALLRADLGETIDESIKSYGDPIPSSMHKPGDKCDEMIFVKDGVWIEARFYDKVCCHLTYQKKTTPEGPNPLDKEWGADNGPFIATEVQALQHKNSEGHNWGKGDIVGSGSSIHIEWKRDDGAVCLERGHILEFTTPSNNDWLTAVANRKG